VRNKEDFSFVIPARHNSSIHMDVVFVPRVLSAKEDSSLFKKRFSERSQTR